MDDLVRFLKTFFILAIFVIPALVPEVAIAASIVIWGAVYLYLTFAAFFHSTANDLPWMIVDPVTSYGMVILFAGFIGLINGLKGSIAMLCAWAPALLLSSYMLTLGLAVEHEFGWYGYVRENYVDPACELDALKICMYRPIGGRELPSFIAERNNLEQVTTVIPYGM